MPAYDNNWDRWIAASINRHIEQNKPADMIMYVEGQERRTNKQEHFIEVRQDGVWWTETSKDTWKGLTEVNILIQTVIGSDLYKMNRMTGEVIEFLTACIAVKRHGTGAQDNGQKEGELELLTDTSRDGHRVRRYGQIDPSVKLMYSTVECSYRIWLT